ncbi:MAG: hypothetical protein ACLRO0_08570 [Massilimicrobiota timonensis]
MNNIHFIPHVHWDREWLRSKIHQKESLSISHRLIDIENDQNVLLTFDGQTALEDYLAFNRFKRDNKN